MQVLLLAKSVVDTDELCADDADVAGAYIVRLSENILAKDVYKAVMDGFSISVAVSLPEHFSFSVHDPVTGQTFSCPLDSDETSLEDMCESIDKVDVEDVMMHTWNT